MEGLRGILTLYLKGYISSDQLLHGFDVIYKFCPLNKAANTHSPPQTLHSSSNQSISQTVSLCVQAS